MANAHKYTKAASGHLFAHFERAVDQNGDYIKFSNIDIDETRTRENYNLAPDRDMSQGEFVRKRCSEVYCLNRKDVNVMCSWVVTLPRDFTKNPGEEYKFFEQTYNFLENKYGKENVISSYVHKDEKQPHMHFAFVPVVWDDKKQRHKVSAKESINRATLKQFHPELNRYLENHFERDVGVMNEATKDGNLSIQELKRRSAIEELEKIKAFEKSESRSKDPDDITFKAKGLKKDRFEINEEDKERIEDVIKHNDYLENVIVSKNKKIKKLESKTSKLETTTRELKKKILDISKRYNKLEALYDKTKDILGKFLDLKMIPREFFNDFYNDYLQKEKKERIKSSNKEQSLDDMVNEYASSRKRNRSSRDEGYER